VIALGAVSSHLGFPINWFFPVEVALLGTSSPKVVKVVPKTEVAIKQEPVAPSPAKKGKQ